MDLFNLSEVLLGRVFIIPDYQREYSWGESQLEAFYKDLSSCPSTTEHLMGSLLTVEYKEVPDTHKSHLPDLENRQIFGLDNTPTTLHEVIDGQQRLTTIMICLAAIGQSLKGHKNQDLTLDSQRDIQRFIRPNFFSDAARKKYAPYSRLIPTMDSKKQFDTILIGDESRLSLVSFKDRKSNKLMLEAHKYFLQVLKNPESALAFYRKIMGNAKFWMHTLSSSAEANIIFECQNNRGIPLTELDKVKNNLIYQVIKSEDTESNKEAVLAKINQTWSSIFKALALRNIESRSDEEKILKDAMIILFGVDKPTLSNLNNELERLRKANKSRSIVDSIGDFVDQLKDIALAYARIISPELSDGNYVHFLNELNFVVEHLNNFRPVLVALLVKKDCLKIEPNQPNPVDSAFQLARDAGFWAYCVVRRQTNFHVKDLGRVANEFYRTTDYKKVTNGLKNFISDATDHHQFNAGLQNFSQAAKPIIYAFEIKNIKNSSEKKEYLAKMELYFGCRELEAVYSLEQLVELAQRATPAKIKPASTGKPASKSRTLNKKIKDVRGVAEGLTSQPTNFYPKEYKNSICVKKCKEYFGLCNSNKEVMVMEVYNKYYAELVEAAKEYFRYPAYFEKDIDLVYHNIDLADPGDLG